MCWRKFWPINFTKSLIRCYSEMCMRLCLHTGYKQKCSRAIWALYLNFWGPSQFFMGPDLGPCSSQFWALIIFKGLNKNRCFVNIYTHNHLSLQVTIRWVPCGVELFHSKSNYDDDDGDGNQPLISNMGLLSHQNLLVLRARRRFCGPLTRGPAVF